MGGQEEADNEKKGGGEQRRGRRREWIMRPGCKDSGIPPHLPSFSLPGRGGGGGKGNSRLGQEGGREGGMPLFHNGDVRGAEEGSDRKKRKEDRPKTQVHDQRS